MKFLLVAVNAKYIHSNPGVYSLKMYAEKQGGLKRNEAGLPGLHTETQIEIAEYTINNQMEQILEDIYRRQPDVAGFSCYIWNIRYVLEIVRDLHKVLPDTDIWLGGPEVSFDASRLLEREPEVLGIMKGEGEETFAGLVELYGMAGESAARTSRSKQQESPGEARTSRSRQQESPGEAGSIWSRISSLSGLAFRDQYGLIHDRPPRPVMDLDRIPFLYQDLEGFENRIIYYESSRGCPFSCSYCLSSVDKTVRFRSLAMVERELQFFLDRKVPQVKFVDRTFNCRRSHAMAVWTYILDHDNGITNFHFEIGADLLDEEELALLARMRPGLIQLEIGVQSTNPATLREIHRKMDLKRVKEVVSRINAGHNIHQHLDLIAGLPYEDYDSFRRSFNEVYKMKPEQLQLGFLKVLKGSHMEAMAAKYGLAYRTQPPYEIISTRWLSFGEVLKLKGVEDMVEVYYNSGQFATTLELMEPEFANAFIMYERIAEYYRRNRLSGLSHSRLARFEILHDFIVEMLEGKKDMPVDTSGREAGMHVQESGPVTGSGCMRDTDAMAEAEPAAGRGYESALARFEDALMCDLYLRENAKRRPGFAPDQAPYKEKVQALAPGLRTLGNQVHVEVFQSGEIWLFDYRKRDPLTWNAARTRLDS